MQNIQFTPNFNLSEFLIHNEAYFQLLTEANQHQIIQTSRILADKLQAFRASINRQILITSAFRSPDYNKFVGGRSNSYHLYLNRDLQGAVDIYFSSINPKKDFEELKRHFNGVIWYPNQQFFHCDNRRVSFYDFSGN